MNRRCCTIGYPQDQERDVTPSYPVLTRTSARLKLPYDANDLHGLQYEAKRDPQKSPKGLTATTLYDRRPDMLVTKASEWYKGPELPPCGASRGLLEIPYC